MNPILKEHLLSALVTFLSTFLVVLGTGIKATGSFEVAVASIGALLIAAAGAAIREVIARFAPLSLGGRTGKTLFGARK